ncbi:MAG: hypothetical protein EOO89_09205 [Pedobacter sp.]|nr:MAG: hypothetical protein EOO89_09205 [Pedobacter sp.]
MKRTRLILCFLLASALFNSCKKDAGNTLRNIAEVKEWYTSRIKFSIAELRGKNGVRLPVKQTVLWDSIKVSLASNGEEVYMIPLEVEQLNGKKMNGNFTLLISKRNGKYLAAPVYESSAMEEYKSPKDEVINHWYSNLMKEGVKVNKTGQLSAGVLNRKMLVDSDGGSFISGDSPCIIDWFLVTVAYDSTGQFLWEEEVYVFSTPCDGLLPGGSDIKESEDVDWGVPMSEKVNVIPSENGGHNVRFATYTWNFHGSEHTIWRLKSSERGKQRRDQHGNWTWDSMAHQDHYAIGEIVGSVKISSFNAAFSTDYNGLNMISSISYKLETAKAVTTGTQTSNITTYSGPLSSLNSWSIQYGW